MPKNIIVFNNGTFCDGSITESIIKELKEYTDYKIIYVANKEALVPGGTKADYTFEFPKFILDDPRLGLADSSTSIIEILMKDIAKTGALLEYVNSSLKTI